MPLDSLVVPAALDGRDGTNRAASRPAQIAATNNLDAVRAWLARFVDTQTTRAARRAGEVRQRGERLAQLDQRPQQQPFGFLAVVVEREERASRLAQASAHWLRHSAGSHMADQLIAEMRALMKRH